MLEKLWNSKYLSWILDVLGIFSLASFLVLGLFLSFIVDVYPSCYFANATIVYVECDKGLLSGFLKFYFQFFSPLTVSIVLLFSYGLFVSAAQLNFFAFLYILFLFSSALLPIVLAFRIIFKISKRLLWKRGAYETKDRHVAMLMLLFVLCPSVFVLALKSYIVPPQSSARIITVDMWHSKLSFPRYQLKDWSLTDIERPAVEPNGFSHLMYPREKLSPFMNLDISYREIDPSFVGEEKISIRLVPHYNVLSEEALFQKREEYLQGEFKKQYRKREEKFKIVHPLYESVEKIKDWEIYKSAIDAPGNNPDIYVHRNEQGEIQNILECIPRAHCAEKSFGTAQYRISYSFDKKYLDSYFDRHQKIINFIELHSISANDPEPLMRE